jgi:hypothetical protein
MCKSKAQGGQRCPGHAAQYLSTKRSALAQVQAAFAAGEATQSSVDKARKEYWSKLVDWSSTTAGAASLREQLAKEPDQTSGQAQGLRRAIDQGALLAQRNREVENEYRAARGKGPLDTPVPLTFEQEASAAAEQAERSAREAAAAADPLGLRAAEAVTPQVTLPPKPAEGAPVRPAMPTHRPIPAPTATVLPTAMPTRAEQQAEAFEALRAQGAEAAAARVASDRAAAEAQRQQAEAELRQRSQTVTLPVTRPSVAEAAAQTVQMPVMPAAPAAMPAAMPTAMPAAMPAAMPSAPVAPVAVAAPAAAAPTAAQQAAAQRREQAVQQRAEKQARNAEVNRLRKEVTARNKKAVDFARGHAVTQFTAPADVWDGPSRFTRNTAPASVKENWAAMRTGAQAYGKEFESLVARHAGRYTAVEVLEACQTLHQKGHQVASGGNAPSDEWYASYRHLDRGVLNQALQSINSEIGPQERALLSQRYVFANADGVLNRTLKQHSRTPRHAQSLMTARVYARWRRFEDRAGALLPKGLLRSSGPAYS